MAETFEMIPMHYSNRSTRGKAAGFVPYQQAREMVEAGFAIWSRKANAIILSRTEAEIKLRDTSSQMGPRVTMAAVMGSQRHQDMVNAWASPQQAENAVML